MNPPPAYPLKFEPIYKEKVWGGRTLERLGRDLPGDESTLIGESWELADLPVTSASGGGGGAEFSKISNGSFSGQTIHDVIEQDKAGAIGQVPLSELGGFPLLLKMLDARQNLSVQVHPSPEYAAEHDDAHLKSEAWYVVDCEPGAKIYKGIQPGTTPEQLRAALEKNTDEAVVPLLVEVPVEPGDCHYLPSGTCHALGAGVLVAEVQTPSDTTYRVYDWGRTGRELHVEQAIACMQFGPAETGEAERRTTVNTGEGVEATRLVRTEYFRIDRLTAPAGAEGAIGSGLPRLWMVIEGAGELSCDAEPKTMFDRGQTLLLPAAMTAGAWKMVEDATILEVTFPQAQETEIA